MKSNADDLDVGGVVPLRAKSRSQARKTSFEAYKAGVAEDAEDEDAGLRSERDYKQKQVRKHRASSKLIPNARKIFSLSQLFLLAYQATGVIYGDIGTSPLYVFSSTFTEAPDRQNLLGALSLILWSITLMVTVKYVLVILRADNDGEGGTFSTYSLLSRYANISKRDPREATMVRMERQLTHELGRSTKTVRSTIEKTRFFRNLLKTIGVLSVSMVMADGVLTPAQSVLGAVQGLSVVKPDISKPTIVGVTCGILILLFLLQPLGISKITIVFSPVIFIWLTLNAGFGIYNLARYAAALTLALFIRPWLMFTGTITQFSKHSTRTMRSITSSATSTRAGEALVVFCSLSPA